MMEDGVEADMNFRDGVTPEIRRGEMMGDRRQAGGRGASSDGHQAWSQKSVHLITLITFIVFVLDTSDG